MKHVFLFFITMLILAALACNVGQETTFEPPPATVLTRVVAAGGSATSPAGNGAANPTPTQSLSLVPTPTLASGADPNAAFDSTTVPESMDSLSAWMVGAYDDEVALPEVCSALQTAQWQQPEATCVEANLDEGDRPGWLVTIQDLAAAEETAPHDPPGEIWFVEANTVFRQRMPNVEQQPEPAPQVLATADLTGDALPEVIIFNRRCTDQNCLYQYQVLSKHFGQMENLVNLPGEQVTSFPLPVISMVNVEREEVRDANGDGVDDFVLQGGREEPAGESPQRARTEVWAFDGQALVLAEAQFAESNFRHHRLYDANAAFTQGDYDRAAQVYEIVIVDESLQDVPSATGSSAAETRAAARQFAGFRLVILPLLRGDITEATRWRNWLQETYPQTAITQAAVQVLSEWETNRNDLAAACATVTATLAAAVEPTDGLADMGPGNPPLEADDICPIQSP